MAAYLVGARGTPQHAVFLGCMVTFTHTISVFALGVVTLYLSRFVLPETITPILGVISGLTIVWVGAMLLYRRTLGRRRRRTAPAGALRLATGDRLRPRRPAALARCLLVHDAARIELRDRGRYRRDRQADRTR